MGEWTWREADQHKCDYPKYAIPWDSVVGDVWQCECGRNWRLSEVKVQKGDGTPREPDTKVGKFTQVVTPEKEY